LAKGGIARAECAGQRRSQIQAIGGVVALCCRKTDLRTGLGDDRVKRRALTGEGKDVSRDAACRRRTFQELRFFVPARARVHGTVIVRDNSDFLDGLLVGGDHSGAAPGQTVHFDTVDLVTVRDVPSSIRVDLYLVLRLENAACGAGPSRSRAAGQVVAAASGA